MSYYSSQKSEIFMFIHITAKKNEPVLLPLSLSLEKNPARKDSVPELV